MTHDYLVAMETRAADWNPINTSIRVFNQSIQYLQALSLIYEYDETHSSGMRCVFVVRVLLEVTCMGVICG